MAAIPPDIKGISGWVPLARGGFAIVWKARQDSLARDVAVKVDDRVLDNPAEQRRFLGEAQAAGALSGHPGIVTVHNAGILPDGRPYLVMDLCPGGSLTSWLDPAHRPSQERVRDVGVQIADALAAAHARGVLHRDVKPANILIDRYGNPGLADFGLTALPLPDASPRQRYAAMTPAYAPPEVLRLQRPSESGDTYQLAATLYALLSGHAPRLSGKTTPPVSELIELHRKPVEPLPGVNSDLMSAILTGLSSDAEARPTAAAFRDQLAAIDLGTEASSPGAEGRAVAASSHGPSIHDGPGTDGSRTTEPKPRRRRRLALGIVLVAILGVLAIVLASSGIYLYQIDQSVNANITRGIEIPQDWGDSAEARPTKSPEAAEALNYVLIGSDEGDPTQDRDGRSDSIMVVHLNQKRDQAYVISFPRDMYVSIPGHGKNRINAAYQIGGPALVVRTIEALTDSRMDHVAMIDFEGFVNLTEDLNGVTVNNRNTFSSHGHNYPKGRITLSGDEALWFVRERRSLPSELERAENQRNVLKAILTKGLSAAVVTDPVRFTNFVADVAKRITVDNSFTQNDIRSTLLSLRLRPRNLVMMQAPLGKTDRVGGRDVHRLDARRFAEFGQALRNDKLADYLDKYPRG